MKWIKLIRCYPTKTGSSVPSESDKNWGPWRTTRGLWIPAPSHKGQPDEELGAGRSRGGEWGRGQWSGGNTGVKSTFCSNLHQLYIGIDDNGNILLSADGSSNPGYSEGDSRWCERGRKWHVVFLGDLWGVCL